MLLVGELFHHAKALAFSVLRTSHKQDRASSSTIINDARYIVKSQAFDEIMAWEGNCEMERTRGDLEWDYEERKAFALRSLLLVTLR